MIGGLAICAGYGGLEEGLRLAGLPVRTVCFVEREAYAAANLVSLMDSGRLAPAPIWDDLRTFDPSEWGPFVSCVSAGFPCGPFSQGGHKAYTDDPRWLWPDIDRILRCLLPSVVFLENVRGLASGPRPGIEHVLGTMASLGYSSAWTVVRACDAASPMERARLFVLAYHPDHGEPLLGHMLPDSRRGSEGRDERRADQGGTASGEGHRRPTDTEDARDCMARPDARHRFPPAPGDAASWKRWIGHDLPLPGVRRASSRSPDRLDAHRLRLLGNGVVPQQAALAASILARRLVG